MSVSFNFTILGQDASLEISETGNHIYITWGKLVLNDASGQIGFWEIFNKTKFNILLKGAAREAALQKFAREWIEREIYYALEQAQKDLAEQA